MASSSILKLHPTMPRILVVGAGLAGLASALALRRSGHQVQVRILSEEGKVSTIDMNIR